MLGSINKGTMENTVSETHMHETKLCKDTQNHDGINRQMNSELNRWMQSYDITRGRRQVQEVKIKIVTITAHKGFCDR